MATNKRTYPNSYFTWYNDDNRIAILTQDTSSTGERTTEKYDTFQGSGSSGSITAFADGDGGTVLATDADHGLITGDTITIAGSTNFGTDSIPVDEVITKVDKDTFRFTASWEETADETGTWSATNVLSGIRITYHAKYEEALLTTNNLQSYCGLDSALHSAVVCYVKSRLYEDDEDIEYANYYRQMYENKIKKFRGRRSAIRHLAVTRL